MYTNQYAQLNQFLIDYPWVVFLIMVWSLFWKGYALWISSKNDSKKWFVALLVFNTVGILDIIFIFYIAKKQWKDLKQILTGKA
jgi:methionyl-tRNA synthetase